MSNKNDDPRIYDSQSVTKNSLIRARGLEGIDTFISNDKNE